MRQQSFARRPLGEVELDLCFACQAIWFDQFVSAQLTPGAILELFRTIHEHRDGPPRPIADATRCVSCHARLKLTQDIERTNHFTYYRCPEGHGRFTTFFQFLREKNFVRSLSAPEIERLKATVTQVRCSSCGAPINVEHDAQCAYCHAPLSILDAEALERTIAELDERERQRTQFDPKAAIGAVLAGQHIDPSLSRREAEQRWNFGTFDLVHEALALLTRER